MTNKEFRFENLSFGDVIIAKRGVNTDNIKEGHKNGPFIVLENNGKYLTCLYCTSQINRKKLIKLNKEVTNLEKDTYVTTNTYQISINEYLNFVSSLGENTKKNIIKSLYLSGKKFNFEMPCIEVGDIIRHGSRYLVIDEEKDDYIVIKIDYDTLELDFSKKLLLPKKNQYSREGYLTISTLNEINKNTKKLRHDSEYQNLKSKLETKKVVPLKTGNLVIYKKMLCYIYYELNDKRLAFIVSKDEMPKSELVLIGGEEYYINFKNKYEFDSNNNQVSLFAIATNEEQENIKIQRKKR